MTGKSTACTTTTLGVAAAAFAAAGAGFDLINMHHVVALIALSMCLTTVGMTVAVFSVLTVGPVKTAFHLGVQAGRTCYADTDAAGLRVPRGQVVLHVSDEVA